MLEFKKMSYIVNLKFKCKKYLIFKFAFLSIQGGICQVAHKTLNVGSPIYILILVVKWSVLVNIIMGFVNLKFKCQKYLIFKFAFFSIQGVIMSM